MGFRLTAKQEEANRLLGGQATHVLLRGGSRSGKTFLILRALLFRALSVKSRHAVLRLRFNHLKSSVVYDTLPKVIALCYPDLAKHGRLDKSDWFYVLPNGSEIWFGGLDDKERTEKILGAEYASIFFNECSQIPWSSRNMGLTRLAQKTALRLRAYYDCNPPLRTHWTYDLFVAKRDPDRHAPLTAPDNYASMLLNPEDNRDNLPGSYFSELQNLPERMRRRFLLGEFGVATEGALWTMEGLDSGRDYDIDPNDITRIIVAVDPSGCSGKEDQRSDEVGIMVCGLGKNGKGYVLEDLSGHYAPGGENGWGRMAVAAYERWSASCIVAEVNFGGAMVREVIRAAGPLVPFKEVRASRGKSARAEPISFLFEQGKAMLAGKFPALEDQLCSMTAAGYVGSKSPDRADAMIWGITELFPSLVRPKREINLPKPEPFMPAHVGDNDWMLT